MSLSPLPLSYCTNVHPGRDVAEVEAGLREFTVPMQQRLGKPLAAGLWLASPVVGELQASRGVPRFRDTLHQSGLSCHTLNAFPFGDFHSPRVKERVYLPDWTDPERLRYTLACADVLAALLPEKVDGSISTLPLGFKEFPHAADFSERAIDQLLEAARHLDRLHNDTGRTIRLAVEPEPFCVLETTPEAIAFFERVFARAAAAGSNAETIARRHLGLCYDVCHQAVEFEEIAGSIEALDRAGVRINKVHITCAIQLDRPAENAEGRRALARYVEPRYLHQTMARTPDGRIARQVDLDEKLALEPAGDFRDAECWRIHFHVPVDAERLGPLATTRAELKQALDAVARLDYAPHLEVETYTWEVLPGESKADLVAGLAREMAATHALLQTVSEGPATRRA